MKTSYFTFGQSHFHVFDDCFFDKNTLLKITSENPRTTLMEKIGNNAFAFEYSSLEELGSLHYYETLLTLNESGI